MKLSLIVPTRNRRQSLLRFLESLAATMSDPGQVEVILVVDEDDADSRQMTHGRVILRIVVVPPGLPMGALNSRGAVVARGELVMLCNDDVIVRTPGWDSHILSAFRGFPDGIVLLHVNDGTFKDSLCVFPCVSRQFMELVGEICPETYRRYRIDDHIYNIFNLLAVLGERRVQYLPDVLFEHVNYSAAAAGRVYVPDPILHGQDTDVYLATFEARKAAAVKLKTHIGRRRFGQDEELLHTILRRPMDALRMRDPTHVRWLAESEPLNSDNTRLTVAVVTAGLHSPHARRCLADLKRYTRNFDLVILDNGGTGNFNHAREMNRLLRLTRTDFLVLMDDDVFVEPGWADGLLRCVNSRVGVVTPVHYDAFGRFNYAGIIMQGDGSGVHRHDLEIPDRPVRTMTLCSAIMLIDMAKCGHLRLDENYSKYFLDIEYGLSVWEAGYEVICTPEVEVIHVGGATLGHGTSEANALHEPQRRYFAGKWMSTGRYAALTGGIWSALPEFKRWVREGACAIDEHLAVLETQRAHRIVRIGDTYFGVSLAYQSLTRGRIERRAYRRLVVGTSLEELKAELDRMVYPALLLHVRIIVYGLRALWRGLWLRLRGIHYRIRLQLGLRVHALETKLPRLLIRFAGRLWAREPGSPAPSVGAIRKCSDHCAGKQEEDSHD